MKDVENLFKRLGTNSEYQDFGSRVLDDVRQKWPLLEDVSDAEKARALPALKASVPESRPEQPLADSVHAAHNLVKAKPAEPESKVPVRSFLSKKRPSQESAREVFKLLGKSPRLSPMDDAKPEPKAKDLFAGSKLNRSKKD